MRFGTRYGMARGEAWCYLTQAEQDAICPKLTGFEWKVYTALATCRNSKTMKTPPIGVPLIMEKTGLGKSTVFAALKTLDESGFILRTACGKRCQYSFVLTKNHPV